MAALALQLPESAAPRRTAVVAAMPEELAPLIARIPSLRGRRARFGRVLRGELGGSEIVLGCTGEGSERAFHGASDLLDAHAAELLLGIGTAGGLTPALEFGTLVVASRLRDDRAPASRPDSTWVRRALAQPRTVEGTVLTSERILHNAAEKRAARKRLNPDGPAVVDLESTAFAAAADRAGVPCLIVRAVCDEVEDDLPFDLNLCRRDDGRIDRFAVARRAVFSPGAARDLMRLRRQVATAAEQLARFVVALLEEEGREHCQ